MEFFTFYLQILLYLVLGANIFQQKRILGESSPSIDSTPSPTYYAPATGDYYDYNDYYDYYDYYSDYYNDYYNNDNTKQRKRVSSLLVSIVPFLL